MDTNPLINLRMARAELNNLPAHPAPAGVSLRWYRRGDEAHWLRIQLAAEAYVACNKGTFRRQFGGIDADLAQRQCYLCDAGGLPIGTATAWMNAHYPERNWSRLHWVAIVPEYQGRGLSKPLLAAVLRRMAELGYDGAYLTTQSVRVAAIRLYVQFGFAPLVVAEQDAAEWERLSEVLKTQKGGVSSEGG